MTIGRIGFAHCAVRLVATLVGVASLVIGCGERGGVERAEWVTMGTTAAVQGKDLQPAVFVVKDVFEKVVCLMNAHDETSELRRLEKLPDEEVLTNCDPLARPCYAAAYRFRDQTKGLFNPRWKGPDTLDLGAIAKGYAVDLAVDKLLNTGIVGRVLVDLGGNLKAVRGSWKVGIAGSDVTLELPEGAACATSAEYYRGKHIKDGRNGGDVRSGVSSVTVVHPNSAMLADGLSTVMFLLGREKGEAFVKEHYPDARVYWTGGMK